MPCNHDRKVHTRSEESAAIPVSSPSRLDRVTPTPIVPAHQMLLQDALCDGASPRSRRGTRLNPMYAEAAKTTGMT